MFNNSPNASAKNETDLKENLFQFKSPRFEGYVSHEAIDESKFIN